MTDEEFIRALEDCSLPESEFHHADHLRGDGGGWRGFARENPELFSPDLLRRHYAPAELDSALVRSVFVLPRPETGRIDLHLARER